MTKQAQQGSLLQEPEAEAPPAAEAPAAEAEGGSNRVKFTLQERLDVIDYLRAQVSPVIGKTKVEVAKQVADALSMPKLTASSLWYIIEETPKAALDKKVAVVSEDDPAGAVQVLTQKLQASEAAHALALQRLEALGAEQLKLSQLVSELATSVVNIEAKCGTSFANFGSDVEALKARLELVEGGK